jgi:peptidoglycan/LPS O-acetylase OafA/YrhL
VATNALAVNVGSVPPTTTRRNRYFDLLRAIALLRVVVYHTAGAWWLHLAFPAIGVMFGLAGSLMARSLNARSAVRVVGSRLRRMLPPVWLYGAVSVLLGWELVGTGPVRWEHVAFWLLPLKDPDQFQAGSLFVDTLWYVRTYLWLVLLSPVLLWLFRRRPVLMLVAPLALTGLYGLLNRAWSGGGLVANLLGYGTCWMLGFAEHEGLLERLPTAWALGTGAVAGLAGLGLQAMHPDEVGHSDQAMLGYALWSAAIVLLVLWWRPDMTWLRRSPLAERLLDAVNARAVTIYLWHDPAIVAATALAALVGWPLYGLERLPLVLLLIAVAMVLVGWVEDLAAGRRPTAPLRLPTSAPVAIGRHRAVVPRSRNATE